MTPENDERETIEDEPYKLPRHQGFFEPTLGRLSTTPRARRAMRWLFARESIASAALT
jgi:hypothetical protein